MFQLEPSVEAWKASMSAGQALSGNQVAELETHLRDAMETLRESSDLTDEEAFLIATRRLGKPQELASEYGKVHQGQVWQQRVIWMLFGYLVVSLFLKFVAVDQATAGLIGLKLGWGSAGTNILTGIPHQWSAVAHMGVGVLGVLIMAWCFAALAKGPRTGGNQADEESDFRLFRWLERAPEHVGKLVVIWIAAYLLLSAVQVGLQIWTARGVTVGEYGTYMASLNLYRYVGQAVTMGILLLVTAWLCRRYQQSGHSAA